jgi:hypothetical protein
VAQDRGTIFKPVQNSASAIDVSTAGRHDSTGAAMESRHQVPSLRARSQNKIDHDIGPELEVGQVAPVAENVFGRQVRSRLAAMEHPDGMARFRE